MSPEPDGEYRTPPIVGPPPHHVFATREEWLTAAVVQLRQSWPEPLPTVRVSVGLPSIRALSRTKRRIGECWHRESTADDRCQIFISPLLTDPVEVLAVLVHELCHATVGAKAGHGAGFKRIAVLAGLTGKMTATIAGEALTTRLTALVATIGEYPHAALNPTIGRKKQSTRMLKIVCPGCGWTGRTTAKWIEQLPTCACGEQMTAAAGKGDEPE